MKTTHNPFGYRLKKKNSWKTQLISVFFLNRLKFVLKILNLVFTSFVNNILELTLEDYEQTIGKTLEFKARPDN